MTLNNLIKSINKANESYSKALLALKLEQDILEAKIDNLESEIELTKMQFERTEYLYGNHGDTEEDQDENDTEHLYQKAEELRDAMREDGIV